MSLPDKPAHLATGADEQSPTAITSQHAYLKRRRSADNTIKDQDAVRDYLTFKQTKGLMTESEKRLLDKIAAVCGMQMPLDALKTGASSTDATSATRRDS
ncbi:MAG: hypothetical protein JSS83_02060 [Cyanobacteria bacterium SZAS LIN-3]|nr:hypothetical protein [Cyanobacteria bacterium SZAS LIN-3]MBS2009721.1 hypothetical protein [Cyanobacteria bacterium SZAS TMP-1]